MSALDDLQATTALLTQAMAHDAVLSLALAATWLDPLHFSERDYADALYGHEEDPQALMLFATGMARECSRMLYVDLLEGLRQGWTFSEFDTAFCEGIKREYPYIPLDSIYDVIYGVPLEFYGLEQTEPDFLVNHPDFAAVLGGYFSVQPVRKAHYLDDDEEAISSEDMEAACKIARPIIDSLIKQDRQPYADLALLLMYLFSISHNTLVDYTTDEYWDGGWEPLEWEMDKLEIADEACDQARIVIEGAYRAVEVLQTEQDVHAALVANIRAVQTALERKDSHVTLAWPHRGRPRRTAKSYRRAAGPDAGLLLIRLCYAEEN